jgi:biotin synthase-like enzyme
MTWIFLKSELINIDRYEKLFIIQFEIKDPKFGWQLCAKVDNTKVITLAEYETKQEAIDVLASIAKQVSSEIVTNNGMLTIDDVGKMDKEELERLNHKFEVFVQSNMAS